MNDEVVPATAEIRTGMAQSLLHEIARRLTQLAETGEVSAIDLRSLPMTTADRSELEDRLGRGEIEALLTVTGTSEIWETRYAGVWWVRHFGAGERVAAEQIEITKAPQILASHPDDVAAAAERLRDHLSEDAKHAGS
jgi:hydrogenase-1 operon protein HyaF